MAAKNNYVFQIIRCLRGSDRPQRVSEILADLNGRTELNAARGRWGLIQRENLLAYLQPLAEIGMVQAHRGDDGEVVWALAGWPRADGASNDAVAGGNGAGRGGRGDGGGTGGNFPGGQGGAGLSEVLAHPVLFCLPNDDQDQLVLRALGLAPDGNEPDEVSTT